MRIVICLLVFCGLLLSHDPALHRTKSLTGQIVSATDTGMELKTRTTTVKIKYSGKTKFALNKKAVDKGQVHAGDWAGVVGNEQHSGEILATEVILGLPSPTSAARKQ